MYHHHSQQQGAQPFSNGPRPPHHQPPPNQHQSRPSTDMLSQTIGFQFPRPTQLPDELESALAIRGARDMDHRLIDHMNRPNQHTNQGSGSGVGQHGSYSANSLTHTSDNQSGHQQGVDWSNYQPPTKLFATPPPSASNQSLRHQGPQQQPQSSHAGSNIPGWTIPSSDLPSSQARHPHGVGGDGQGLYTPESAGSILASFGLSNEDLEVLSHYPDDQLTPDTLPFILRDIQINKSGNQKPATSASSTSFVRNIHDMLLPPSRSSPLPRSCSPEVPSLLTVTQTAGKVIDYGHASRSKEENSTRETFKREQLSGERTVKMYTSSPTSTPKVAEKTERRQVRLEHTEPSKHGDQDYRRVSRSHRKISRSPGREFPTSTKSRNLDRDYRHEGPKPRPSSETRSEASSSSSGRKLQSTGKKLPTPTMISDFSAVSPKVYPHTCSLCHIQCDQEKDWVDHNNTVNHTAACRELRTKYPDWKPTLPSDRYGGRPKDDPLPRSISRSFSRSPIPSPHGKHRPHPAHVHRPHGRPYSPHRHPRHHHYPEHGHRLEHSGSHSPPHSHRGPASYREQRPEKRDRESSGVSSRGGLKRPHTELTQRFTDTGRHPPFSKAGYSFKHGTWQTSSKLVKSGMKIGTKVTKLASAKAADTSAKPPPAKKKKKILTAASQSSSVTHRLVYLADIPKDASEQEVTDLVGTFGSINNVVLMPCSEEESQRGEGQKASVCMVKAEDAQALANSTNLSIRDQQITASLAKKPEPQLYHTTTDTTSKPAPAQDKGAPQEESGGEADQKTSDEKGIVLVTGLPEEGWSENDIISLFQPFGTPSDIIMATSVGKVLVSVPDMEIAEEIVKIHAFIPAKIKDTELKMIHFKQRIGMDTPVALYNLLMGSLDPLESPSPLAWGRLLVIRNVPDTPSGSSEVQKLVQRFGTVIKTLALKNMVICEMATISIARSVHKRFQKFPCIIQNNPLFFSRKRDPKVNTQTKVLTAYLDSPEDTPANGKDGQTEATTTTAAVAEEEETGHEENSESPLEGKEEKDGEEEVEKMVVEDKASDENGSKDDELIKDEPTDVVSNSTAEAEPETDVRDNAGAESVVKTPEEAAEAGNDKTPVGEETSTDKAIPKIPKVTQEMVNALLVECRTRMANRPDKPPPSTEQEQGETPMVTAGSEKAEEDPHEPKKPTEDEEKKQERERKEREARREREAREREKEARERERERKERERKERAKREREREERARRDREKREEERREWERREKERRERKRAYGEASYGSRSYGRSESYRQSSWRDDQYYNSEPERSRMVEEEEEEFEDFPFNLSDFVTVDEVGDVADLPHSPPTAVSMETSEGGRDVPTTVQQDTSEDAPMEEAKETTVSDSTATPVNSVEVRPEPEPEPVPAATTTETSDSLTSSDLTAAPVPAPTAAAEPSSSSPSAAPQAASPCSQTHATTCQPEAPDTKTTAGSTEIIAETETETTPPAVMDSTTEVEPQALNHSQTKEEMEMTTVEASNETEEKLQVEEDKTTEAPAAETEKNQTSDNQSKSEEESVKTSTEMTEANYSLPPYDSSNPVGMEFLVPKTGFFCKVCNRFFNGAKEAELNHCKTLKHYDNLQKFLQTRKP